MRIDSTNLSDVEWNEVKGGIGTLDVIFHTGDNYVYKRVPKGIYEKLLAAPSKGKFFDQFVVKAGYDYVKKNPPRRIPGEMEVAEPELNTLRSAIEYLEKRGMAKREQDEQGNFRVVLMGEITRKLFKN